MAPYVSEYSDIPEAEGFIPVHTEHKPQVRTARHIRVSNYLMLNTQELLIPRGTAPSLSLTHPHTSASCLSITHPLRSLFISKLITHPVFMTHI